MMKFLADLPSPNLTIPPQSPTGSTGAVNFSNLRQFFPSGGVIDLKSDLTIGEILTHALNYIFVIAGLILLFMLISGGFKMITGASNPKAKESASKTITSAFIGFIVIFLAYWLVQIVEIVLGISILK